VQDLKADTYWNLPSDTVLEHLHASSDGLTEDEAAARLKTYGENSIHGQERIAPLVLFLNQFKNLIILIMLVATAISAATGDGLDSLIIFLIVLASAVLSFLQEYHADNTISELRSKLQIKSVVLRGGHQEEILTRSLVPGDIVKLSAGTLIPADGLVLSCDALYVNQSVLTGEAFSVEKKAGEVAADANLTDRKNCVFMGTNVRSGSALMLVVHTGEHTEFGQIAKELESRPPETEFGRGVRHFSYMLAVIMLILAIVVFAVNLILDRPVIDSLLFSVALAVGITPQLLPAIINITLAKGAQVMEKEGVIVRNLTSLENFGSMDILCTDKTGTLTEGVVRLDGAVDIEGQPSDEVLRLAYLNASLQTGMVNETDEAIVAYRSFDTGTVTKHEEIPFDFYRMRMSVIAEENGTCRLITKGALKSILGVCHETQIGETRHVMDTKALEDIQARFQAWSEKGYRVLGVAQKSVPKKEKYAVEDERAMVFMGFLLFFDPPKADAAETVSDLVKHGVGLRIITGDNKLAALHIASAIGLNVRKALTGPEIAKLSDQLLENTIETVDLFAEVDPSQKERILLALKKKNHVVGYMGDGINDAPALHAADVSISVSSAVDVAKESANFVLQEKSLRVLIRGIELGRTTFANTLKYIWITTSANFGNMFSMAGASLFLPFLPLLPKQILMINFITDFPAVTIAEDSVDEEMIRSPHRWNIRFICNFMVVFGLISSVFDYLCFAILLLAFDTPEELFRSGWFVLSILTELVTLLAMRTKKPFYRSKPAPILLFSTVALGLFSLAMPYLPFHQLLDLISIPLPTLASLLGIAVLYLITIEITKHFFYRSKLGRTEKN